MPNLKALKVQLQKSIREQISDLEMHHDANYIIATICSMELIVAYYKKQILLRSFPEKFPDMKPANEDDS